MHMKIVLLTCCLLGLRLYGQDEPVLKNFGLPAAESFEISEVVDPVIGRVDTKVDVKLTEKNGSRFYLIHIVEGDFFSNEIWLKYNDLTTVSEKRTDLKTGKVIQSYSISHDTIHFFSAAKKIDKKIISHETNIYSPLAFYYSFRGFPFGANNNVSFHSYIYQYGGPLTMDVLCTGEKSITVKAGTYNCYELVLSVGGWQSFFATDKYYLYFSVAPPHIFVKYAEMIDGKWSTDELIKYNK